MTSVFCLSSKINKIIKSNYSFLILPIFWIGFEYLHLNWDLSWPWLTLGNVFASHPHWIQWYSFTGVLGGTSWIFLINLLIFKLYQYKSDPYLRNIYLSLVILGVFIPIYLSNFLYNKTINLVSDDTVNIMIVQPNIDPYKEKFTLPQQHQTQSLLNFISPKIDTLLDFLILPETFFISPIWSHKMDNNLDIKMFSELLNENSDLNIIVGATVLELSNKVATSKPLLNHSNQFYKVYNSALQLNLHGISSYYKSKLVPGAEQMPFQRFLYPILGNRVLKIGSASSIGNFSKQDTVSVFTSSNKQNSAPIICYESIYGDYVRRFINKGAQIIFIITNDGWWKKTSGYKQHNMYAKLRAIETQRYVARSANTGISSIINPVGELERSVGWNKKEIIKCQLPLYSQKTFYVQHGDFIGRLCAVFSILILLYFFVVNKLKISY